MVYYFVIAEDGTRYGPADIDTLLQWAREGRLIESTTLIERGTERSLRAVELTALEAEFRRVRGASPAVTIERGSAAAEPVTMTHPGMRQPAGRFPTAPGAPPPVPKGGVPVVPYAYQPPEGYSYRNKLAAGLLGIFLGGFGAHRFYLGYHAIGFIQLVLTIVTCGTASLWGLIEGILCLTGHMRDVEGRPLRD